MPSQELSCARRHWARLHACRLPVSLLCHIAQHKPHKQLACCCPTVLASIMGLAIAKYMVGGWYLITFIGYDKLVIMLVVCRCRCLMCPWHGPLVTKPAACSPGWTVLSTHPYSSRWVGWWGCPAVVVPVGVVDVLTNVSNSCSRCTRMMRGVWLFSTSRM